MPITRGTKQATLFGRADEIFYFLRATFDTADQGFANAQVLDTIDEGVQDGQLTVVELDGTLAIVSNKTAFTSPITPAWTDLGLVSNVLTKIVGMVLLGTLNKNDATKRNYFAWSTNAALGTPSSANKPYSIYFTTPSVIRAMTIGTIVGSFSASTEYFIAIVLGGYNVNGVAWYSGQLKTDYLYGGRVLIKGGVYTTWTLLWSTDLDDTASLYAVFLNYSDIGTLDDFRVPDKDLSDVLQPTALSTFAVANGTSLDAITPEVGGGWTEQSGDWDIQSNRANPDGAAIATVDTSIADMLVDCTVNGATADNPAVVLRFLDTSNYWYLQADRANNQLELHEYNATVDTIRANAAVTINNSTDYNLRAITYGQTIDGFIDAANKISYGSAALNETETVHGIRAENTAGRFDNFVVFPRTAAIYDTTLDAV